MKSPALRLRIAPAFLAAALVMLTAGLAGADGKAFPGNVCQPMNGAENSSGQFLYHDNPSIRNYGSSLDRYVVCPLVRDNNGNTNGLNQLSVEVDVQGAPVTCAAVSMSQTGSFLKTVFKASGSTTGPALLDFTNTVNISAAKGVYDVQCTLPPRAAVLSINYDEF